MDKLKDSDKHQHMKKLVEFQVNGLIELLDLDLLEEEKSKSSQTPAIELSAESINIDLTKITKFSPLLNENAKIPCPAQNCKSRFKYKRSYEAHILKFHDESMIDHNVKDPGGTCLMKDSESGKVCGSKLPIESILYHLEHIHGITR